MASQTVLSLTADTTPATTDLAYEVKNPAGTPLDRKVTWSAVLALRGVQQIKNVQSGAVATGTTTVPLDDTIPQNTEGTEFMTLAITPTSATNKLKIDVVFLGTFSVTAWLIVALFQDTTAGALAVGANFQQTGTDANNVVFTHYMTAGTTSATTFKVRAGGQTAGTVTFNGQSTARLFGGVNASSITITELVP